MKKRTWKKIIVFLLILTLGTAMLPHEAAAADPDEMTSITQEENSAEDLNTPEEVLADGEISDDGAEEPAVPTEEDPQDEENAETPQDEETTEIPQDDPSGEDPENDNPEGDPEDAADPEGISEDPQESSQEDSDETPEETMETDPEENTEADPEETDTLQEDPEDPENANPEETEEELETTEEEEEPSKPEAAEAEEEEVSDKAEPIPFSALQLSKTSLKYKGKKLTQTITVTAEVNGKMKELTEGKDYTVKYKNNLNVGTATVTVTGLDRFEGSTLSAKFKITPASITTGTVTVKHAQKVYTGKAITQNGSTVVTANPGGSELTLVRGTDYTITYANNVKVGTATLTVTGIGNYKDTVTKEFRIIPQTMDFRMTMGTKRFTAKWDEHTAQTTGFQVQYSLYSNFSGKKTLTIRDNAAVQGIVTGLSAGKTYYVRVRAYKKTGGVNYFSKWSTVKTIKLRKNALGISGSGDTRTIVLHNPSGVNHPDVAVWSDIKGQDDLLWFDMQKKSDGSYRTTVSAAYFRNYGVMNAHCYSQDSFLEEKTFSFSKSDYKASENTVEIDGSGVMQTVTVYNPSSTIRKISVAVWSEKNGQDDLAWIDMTKKSDGTWSTDQNMTNLLSSGLCHAHVYANTAAFLGAFDFSVKFGMEPCSSEQEYIQKIAPAVQRVCKKYGYLPSVLIAQSCLENGYGIPSYWDNPEITGLIYYCNMVGLKSELLSASWAEYTVWGGESLEKKTPEVYNGVSVIITDSFRIYDSIEQSFADYLLFMKYASNYGVGGTPKYGETILKQKDPEKLIKAVSRRGYATGTTYPTSVMRIINKHNLTQYDDLSKVKATKF